MSLKGKIINEIDIKSDAHMFYDFMRLKPHELPKICTSGKLQACELHEGEWGTAGSVICWNYLHDGVAYSLKERVEPDAANNKTKFTFLEGDILNLYKTFVATLHADKHATYGLVAWSFEYEKINEDIPDPDSLMDFFTEITRDIESYHLA